MNRRRPVVLAALALTIAAGCCAFAEPSFKPNVDLPGNDYTSFELQKPRPRLCQEVCLRDGKCEAWTYVHPGFIGPLASCWLKSKAEPPQANPCCISGTK
jgi:hypothetical protein